MNLFINKVKNTMEKGENAGYQHFFLFPQCFFSTAFSPWSLSPECVVKIKIERIGDKQNA